VTQRPGRPRSAAADTAILAATRSLLGEVGYAALSMEGVAARAGVAKTTLYRRWPTKAALVADTAAEVFAPVPLDDHGSLRADLEAVVRATGEILASPLVQAAYLGIAAESTRDAVLRGQLESGLLDRMHKAAAAGVARAVRRGEVPAGTDPELLYDVLAGALTHRQLVLGKPADAAYRARLVTLVTSGLGPSGQNRAGSL
jgi:AcrR family transcriptional regulator